MAKKKIKGTEDETTKTRKEIRQERRQAGKEIRQERKQMKAINAGRPKFSYDTEGNKIKNDPLYTKQEIRDVKEPFEPQESRVLTGTKDGTTYNDPNQKPEVQYIQVDNYAPSKFKQRDPKTGKLVQGFMASTGRSLSDAMLEKQKAGYDPSTGENVKKVLTDNIIADKNTSLEEKQQLIDAANVAKTEVNKTDEQINDQTKEEEKIISTTDPNAIGGSGASVAGVMDKAPAGPEWTSVVPTGQQYQAPSREEIYEQARQAKVKAPNLVVEKLGLQDYYPEAGRNIAVGNFSGSYAGSRTIYSGAGGLLPLGLYDARKRAIATDIKKKEAIMDQLKEIPDIAKQFQPYYSEKFMNFLSPWMDAFKDKPEELMRNTDFLKGLRQQQAVAENFLKVDTDLKEFEALVNPGDKGAEKGGYGAYATPAMLEILHKFKAGMLPGKIEEWFDGTKNISDLTKTVQAMPSGYKWADDTVKLILEKGQAEIPIYPKDGVNWRDPKVKEAAMKDVNGLVVSLKDGSPDYETYLTSLKKYFSFDFETMTKEWIEGNSLNALTDKEKEEYKKSLTAYMLSKMPPDSIVNKVEMQANQAAKRTGDQLDYAAKMADIAADMEKFNKSREDHNSDTRAQVESMERTGANETFLPIANPIIAPSKTTNKEYKVWMMNPKGEWRQQFVAASEITRGNEAATKNGNSMYFSNKGGSQFNVPSSGYFGVTENGIRKQGNNYIGNQYGVMFTPGKPDPDTGEIQYTPNGVEWRKPDDVIKSSKGFNSSAEIGFNNSAGQDPKAGAKNLKAGGGKSSDGSYQSSYSRGPADN
jgi:hypothetical protein